MGKLNDLLLEESDLIPQFQIYCDMDGVLTDFERRFLELLRTEGKKYYSREVISQVVKPKDFERLESSKEFWKFIDQYIGIKFWSEMPWMAGGKTLWSFIQPYNPIILTSPSRDNTSRLGKRLWVKDNLVPAPPVEFRFKTAKADFSNKNAILIDDRDENLEAFAAKGGIALKCIYGNITPVINKLTELGYGRELA